MLRQPILPPLPPRRRASFVTAPLMTDAAIADLTPTTAPSWEPPPAVARRIARGTTPVVGPEPVTRVRLELPLPLPVQVRP
ncbi:MAG: hypothetical protein KC464_35980, partial [Myxococcales bacterium]|nr:hypothetical protein [Myxococcales bacterium]